MRRHGPSPMLVAVLASLGLLAGCERHADKAHADEHRREWTVPAVGITVNVYFVDLMRSVDVNLSSFAADGAGTVSVADVWRAAWPAEDPASLRFDFVAYDGYRPSKRPECARFLSGRELASIRIEVATHDLVLGEAANLPGCYVRAVTTIEARR